MIKYFQFEGITFLGENLNLKSNLLIFVSMEHLTQVSDV